MNFYFLIWFAICCSIILTKLSSRLEHQPALAQWIDDLFAYGKQKKLSDQQTRKIRPAFVKFFIDYLHVPKRWFTHFYCYGFAFQNIILVLYLLADTHLFHFLTNLNQLIFSSKSFEILGSVSRLQILAAYLFLQLQISRRLYECMHVSIFSNTTIHITHYLIGYLFYTSVNLLEFHLLFQSDQSAVTVSVSHGHLLVGGLIYVIGFIMQHITMRQFANLRSSKKVDVQNKHYMPQGFMFEYISCPHYFGEILIYLGITILLQWNINSFIMFAFVFLLHLIMANDTHNWYLKMFASNYPKNRRALIPYVW